MKKYLFFFLAIQFTINSFSQTPAPGQLKITIESFKCINQSWDGLVEFDGHGNEVFIDYGYRIYNPSTPNSSKAGAGFTPVFGSAVNGQIKAGTASAIGGIANGNEIMVNTLVLNEHVDADNLILFSPSVWELDNSNNDKLNLFNQQLATDLNWVMAQPYPFLNVPVGFDDPFNGRFIKTTDKYNGYWPLTKYLFLSSLVNIQENRPVGIHGGTFNGETLALYNPALLILDPRALITFYNHNQRVRETNHPERGSLLSGLVEMVFTENTYAIVTSNGSYSLKLKIEFTPDPTAPAPPPPAPAPKYTKLPLTNKFPNQPNQIINTNITGKWTGTYGSGESATPTFYSFQLNTDGSMQLLNESGGIIAGGTYSFTNNVLTANYRYSSGSEFSLTGILQNNTLSGTWGSYKNVSGGGKWIMNKN